MDFGKRLTELRKERGFTRTGFAEYLGIPNTTLRNYETNQREPGHVFLKHMADIFKVSVDYLLGITDDRAPSILRADFNSMEIDHIKKYRDLDSHGKELVDLVLDKEVQRINSDVDKLIHVIPINLSLHYCSAGTSAHLGPEEFKTIYVQENDLTKQALFAVSVCGDSMEPNYSDGDILIVGKPELQIGDIGIFTLDGEEYVKKLGEKELIPTNNHYNPIPIDDSIVVNGKVIGKLDPDWIVEQ